MSESAIEKLERRSYASYRGRLEAEKRLRRVGRFWSASQLLFGITLVIISLIFALTEHDETWLTICLLSASFATVVISVTVSAANYSSRAQAMFQNYRQLQALSVELETLALSGLSVQFDELSRLQSRYDSLLDGSENHSEADYRLYIKSSNRIVKSIILLTSVFWPLVFIVLALGLLIVAVIMVI